MPRHSPYALLHLNLYLVLESNFLLNCLSFVNKLGFFSLRIEKAFCALFVILNLFFHLAVKLYFFTLYWKDLSNLFFKIKSVLFLSVRFTLQYTLFGFQ